MDTYKLHHLLILKLLLPFSSLFFIFLVFIANDPDVVIARLILLFLSIASVFGFLHVLTDIEYDKTSIKVKKIFQEPSFFQWNDIGTVRARIISRSLHFSDQQGNRLFGINMDMVGAKHFFEYLSKKAPNIINLPVDEKLRPNSFVLAYVILLNLSIGGMFFWFLSQINLPFGIVTGSVFLLLALVEIRRSTLEIIPGRDRLMVTSILGTKEYPLSIIESIDLVAKKSRNQKNYHINISTNSEKPVKLFLQGHNPIILYLQLKSWFDKAKGSSDRH